MSLPTSPLAPKTQPSMPAVDGFRLATCNVGGFYGGRENVLMIEAATGSSVAGVFTKNAVCGAPVAWTREVAKKGLIKGLLVNAGNANVALGKPGMAAAAAKMSTLAQTLDCSDDRVALASTGVIGAPLDPAPYQAAIPALHDALDGDAWRKAATAIMTTDTFPKMATASCEIDGQTVTINAIAKGSGMIEPNMATMLAFVATDANLSPEILDTFLRECVDVSLNAVTVDGDTSTSDMCLLMASRQVKHAIIDDLEDERLDAFLETLKAVMIELAQLIARDGEGAQKLITIDVTGASDSAEAMIAAKAVANSPLVKTAIAGEDANWGRIAMALGKSGAKLNQDRLAISMGGLPIVDRGGLIPGYDETPVAAHIKGQDVTIAADLGVGHGKARVWTCDLTHGYIDINADYRS